MFAISCLVCFSVHATRSCSYEHTAQCLNMLELNKKVFHEEINQLSNSVCYVTKKSVNSFSFSFLIYKMVWWVLTTSSLWGPGSLDLWNMSYYHLLNLKSCLKRHNHSWGQHDGCSLGQFEWAHCPPSTTPLHFLCSENEYRKLEVDYGSCFLF